MKAFTAIQWVMVLAVAVVFGFALDGLWAVIIGAVVGVILVAALILFGREPDGTSSGRDRTASDGETSPAADPRTGATQDGAVGQETSRTDAPGRETSR